MPLYEYQCDQCGERFEKIQKFSDPPLETCAKCGGGPIHKLIAAPAFHLKGSGWYITDYARKDSGGGKAEGSKEPGTGADKSADDSKKDAGKTEGVKEEKASPTDSGKKDTTSTDTGSATTTSKNTTPKNA
jgi:putative FmdB family regulatory protein